MGPAKLVYAPGKGRLSVANRHGNLGQSFPSDEGKRIACQEGHTEADVANGPVALLVVHDPLAAQTTFDSSTGTLIEAGYDYENAPTWATAYFLREVLTSTTWGTRFADFVKGHNGDMYVAADLAWHVRDEIYAPFLHSPGVDAVKHHTRLLSKGKRITVNRPGRPSMRMIALDLERTWAIARQYEVAFSAEIEEWRAFQVGPDALATWRAAAEKAKAVHIARCLAPMAHVFKRAA